jgi:signal transduction histidine kinase
MELSGPVNPEQKSQLDRIAASGNHLIGLVDQVLDFARIEAGTLRVQRRDGHEAENEQRRAGESAEESREPGPRWTCVHGASGGGVRPGQGVRRMRIRPGICCTVTVQPTPGER